jgi:hypothetical protein
MKTQCETIGKLLQRKRGVTCLEMIEMAFTTTPTRRLSDLREMGWTITKKPVLGQHYFRFFGIAPKAKTPVNSR